MHEPATVALDVVGNHVWRTCDIDRHRHGRIQFARFQAQLPTQLSTARKPKRSNEERRMPSRVLGVVSDDAGAAQPPRLQRPDADDLAGIAFAESSGRR